MTDIETTPAHRFTVGGALGFGFEVLKARPQSVLILLIGQALISSLINVGFACVAYAVLASLHRCLSGPAATATVPTTRED